MNTEFINYYLETVLWAEMASLPCAEDDLVDGYMNVDEDHPLHGIWECHHLDKHFNISDFTASSLRKASYDCDLFLHLMEEIGLFEKALEYKDEDSIAHDFWLIRNGHGAGFFDDGYEDYIGQMNSVGDQITALVRKNFDECTVSVLEDGTLELS